MKCSFVRPMRHMVLCLVFSFIAITVPAQRVTTPPQRPVINLDNELEQPITPDRAASYYHFSLAKWYEDAGELSRALSEMQTALKYNQSSPAVHLEMASLLAKSGDIAEAIRNAEEAIRLDPKNPDPHWFLANIYFRRQEPGAASNGMQLAIQELEKLKELTPSDERIYFILGGAFFSINEPEKAIESYEKFQSLSKSADNGYREIARYYERKGAEEKAIEYLNKGLKVQPDSAETLLMLASIYRRQGKNKQAVPLYKQLMKLTDSNAEVSRDLAASLIDERQYAEALKILDDLAKDASVAADPFIQSLRGKALFGLRRYSDAIQTLEPVTEKEPDLLEASFYLGRAYEETGKYAEAAKIFEVLVQKPAGNSEEARNNHMVFQQQLAADYFAMGNHDKAIAIYQEMAKEDPKRANPRIVDAYRLSKQFDKALEFGKEQFEKDPGIEIGYSYARALADAGKPKQGAEIVVKLLQTEPDNIDLYVLLSQIYLQDKRYAEAEKILRRAQEKTSDSENSERLKFQLATVYEKQQEMDRAESVLREILKANPQSAGALNYIGYMLADRGIRLEEAVKYVREALAIEPQNGAYLDSLGWAFFKLNDLANAEKYLLEAIAFVKDDPTIEDHLGDLYFKTGDLKKAEEYWKKSINVGTEQEEIQKVRRKLDMLQETLRKQKQAK
jgi:tetratricopeptide (TPR) repeat protein